MILLRPWLKPPLTAEEREVDEIGQHIWMTRRARERDLHLARRLGMVALHHQLLMGATNATNDPQFSSVSLLLPLTDPAGTTFTDRSPLAHTMTRSGVTASTAQTKWAANSSMLFNSINDRLACTGTGANEFSYTGDFSIELWVRFASSIRAYMFDHQSNVLVLAITPSSGLVELYQGSHLINTGSTPFSLSTWYFIQVVRSGSTVSVARDGSVYATATNATTLGNSGATPFSVGNFGGLGLASNGAYMQDFRITKGYARALAVPTAAFPTS